MCPNSVGQLSISVQGSSTVTNVLLPVLVIETETNRVRFSCPFLLQSDPRRFGCFQPSTTTRKNSCRSDKVRPRECMSTVQGLCKNAGGGMVKL